jgi:hypothetical protein
VRRDWLEGTRFAEVKGYGGYRLSAPETPPVPPKPQGRGAELRLHCEAVCGMACGKVCGFAMGKPLAAPT